MNNSSQTLQSISVKYILIKLKIIDLIL